MTEKRQGRVQYQVSLLWRCPAILEVSVKRELTVYHTTALQRKMSVETCQHDIKLGQSAL